MSPTQTSVFFYNSSRGSTFITWPTPWANISVDTNFTTSIKGIKLNNSDNFDVRGVIEWLKEKEKVDSYESRKSLSEVFAVTLDLFPGCTNKACGKLVLVIPDEAATIFLKCNTTMKVSKCPCVFHFPQILWAPTSIEFTAWSFANFFSKRCHKNV